MTIAAAVTRDPHHQMRQDPDSHTLSLQQAQEIAKLPYEIKTYLLATEASILRHLLPEHREIIIDSLSPDGVDETKAAGVEPMSPADRATLLGEIMGALHAEGDRHRGALRDALSTQDRMKLVHLIGNNTYSAWHVAHVLAPFAREYAVELGEMDVDPETVIAEATCRDKSRWITYLREVDLPPVAANSSAPPSASRPPAPTVLKTPPVRPRHAPYVVMDGKPCSETILRSVLTDLAQGISADIATAKLAAAYSKAVRFSDAIEATIREDETPAAFDFPQGDVRNATHRAMSHPLATVLRLAHDIRLRLAEILSRRPDAVLPDPSHSSRLPGDAAAAAPAPVPVQPPTTDFYSIPTAPAPALPPSSPTSSAPPVAHRSESQGDTHGRPNEAKPPPAFVPPPHQSMPASLVAPPRPKSAPASMAPTQEMPRPRWGVSLTALLAPLQKVERAVLARMARGSTALKTRAALNRPLPVAPNTRSGKSVGKTILGLIKLCMALAVMFVAVYSYNLLRQHTYSEYRGMLKDYMFGDPRPGNFVKARDKVGVFVFSTAAQARDGNLRSAFQGLYLTTSDRYQVVNTEGDVLQIVIADQSGRQCAVWVRSDLVKKVH